MANPYPTPGLRQLDRAGLRDVATSAFAEAEYQKSVGDKVGANQSLRQGAAANAELSRRGQQSS